MKLYATTIVNLIDAHLRKFFSGSEAWKDTSLREAIPYNEERFLTLTGTFNKTKFPRLHWAYQQGDAFAAIIENNSNHQEWLQKARQLNIIVEIRNKLAHGEPIESLSSYTEYGIIADETGLVELPEFLEHGLSLIKVKGIDDNVELFPVFRDIKIAVAKRHKLNPDRSISVRVLKAFKASANGYGDLWFRDHMSKQEARSYWKFNNIRNRYAHTGHLNKSQREWLKKYAAKYGVEIEI